MQKSMQRLRALIRKETIQLLRDRRLLTFILGLPILELFLYGYAANLTVYHLPMAVVDQSHDRKSREFIQMMVNSQYFDDEMQLASQEEAIQAINRGEVKAGVVIPAHFAADADKGNADILILLDGTDNAGVQSGYSAAALIAQEYGQQLIAKKVTSHVVASAVSSTGGLPIMAATRILYNPDLKDIWIILPGLVGLILQTMAITQAVIIMVRDRELGTSELILMTPVRPLELIVSKMIPLLALCIFAMGAVLGIGVFWFGVPFQGSILLYVWLTLLFIAASLGLGLLLSTRATNQMEATQYGMIVMLMGMLMSGFMYPLDAMPMSLRLVGGLFPVTYFIRISRSIFVKGVGLQYLWSDGLILAVYTLIVFIIAAKNYKYRLD